jgi:hypothetical protein
MAKFVVYERVSELVYKQIDKSQASSTTNTLVNLGSGLIAGFAAAIVSQPADTMLSKINKTKGLPGEGTMSRLVKIGKELGVRGSYAGIGARLFMVGTLTAGQFAIYGDIKKVSCFTTHCVEITANVLQGLGCIWWCRNREVEKSDFRFRQVVVGIVFESDVQDRRPSETSQPLESSPVSCFAFFCVRCMVLVVCAPV